MKIMLSQQQNNISMILSIILFLNRLSSNDLMRRTASSSTIGRMKSNTSNDSLSKQRELKKT